MSKDSPSREAIRAYLRLLGNPHAKSQIIGAEEELDPDLRSPTEAERQYAYLLGNQYALLSIAIAEQQKSPLVSDPAAALPLREDTLSKADFVAECRRIFRLYVPAVERGALRPHHRAFISRNQTRDPATRYQLAHHLRKYDLSSSAGIQARFNRERGELTEQKLRQIEQSVLKRTTK